jgi:hypothetical protein
VDSVFWFLECIDNEDLVPIIVVFCIACMYYIIIGLFIFAYWQFKIFVTTFFFCYAVIGSK